MNRRYVGGDVLYLDGVDPDKISMTELVNWTYDIGYEHLLMQWWFKIPGSEDGSGFLPATNDSEACDMCNFVSPKNKLMELFTVCELERREFKMLSLINLQKTWIIQHFWAGTLMMLKKALLGWMMIMWRLGLRPYLVRT